MRLRGLYRYLGICVAVAFAWGCVATDVSASVVTSQQELDPSIEAFLHLYVQAVKERDVEAVANMHKDPVTWTDFTGSFIMSRAELKVMLEQMYFYITEIYDVYVKDVTATLEGDIAVVRFTGGQDQYNSALQQRVATEWSVEWTLERMDGRWYIAKSSSGM